MIRRNRNGFLLLAMQHHPRTHSRIRGLWWQRPETQAQVISIFWSCGSMVFYKLLTAAWEILQHPKQRTLEQALLCFPSVWIHLLTKLSSFPWEWFSLSLLLYIVREMERLLHSENVFKISHPINPIFALWSCLRVHKMACFQVRLNQKTGFWVVSRGILPLMALIASSIPLHTPTLGIVDIGTPVPTVSPHRFNPIASHYSAVWASVQMLQPGSCWFMPLLIWTAVWGLWSFQFNWSMSSDTSSALQVVNFKICRVNSLIVYQDVHALSMSSS